MVLKVFSKCTEHKKKVQAGFEPAPSKRTKYWIVSTDRFKQLAQAIAICVHDR